MTRIKNIEQFITEGKASKLDINAMAVGQDVFILKIKISNERFSRTKELYDENKVMNDYLFVKRSISEAESGKVKINFNDEHRTSILIDFTRNRISTDTRNGGGTNYSLEQYGNVAVYGLYRNDLLIVGVDETSVRGVVHECSKTLESRILQQYEYIVGEYEKCIDDMKSEKKKAIDNLKAVPLHEPRYIPYL